MEANIDRDITTLAKQVVQKLIAACPDCGGDGIHNCGNPVKCQTGPCACEHGLGNACKLERTIKEAPYRIRICPICANLRALDKELCWHEQEGVSLKCLGGTGIVKLNPTYTIQSLRKLLEGMGLWYSFRKHVRNTLLKCLCHMDLHISNWLGLVFNDMADDILTSDTLMAQAVLEYLKGRLK